MNIINIQVVYLPAPFIRITKSNDISTFYEEIEFNELGKYIQLLTDQQTVLGKYVSFSKGTFVYKNRNFDCVTIAPSDIPQPVVTNFVVFNSCNSDVVINSISGINVVYTEGTGYNNTFPIDKGESRKGLIQNAQSGLATLELDVSAGSAIDIGVYSLGAGVVSNVQSLPAGTHDFVIPYSIAEGQTLVIIVGAPPPNNTPLDYSLVSITNDPTTLSGTITGAEFDGLAVEYFSGNDFPLSPGQSGLFKITNPGNFKDWTLITSGISASANMDYTDGNGNFTSQIITSPNTVGGSSVNSESMSSCTVVSGSIPQIYNGSVANNSPNGNVINSVKINDVNVVYQSGNNLPQAGFGKFGFFGNPGANVPSTVNIAVNISAGVNPPTLVRVTGTNGVTIDQPFVADGNYIFVNVVLGGTEDLWRVELNPLD